MKLKFNATNQAPKHTIVNEAINNIDLSVFPEGGKFIGNDETKAAGIYAVESSDGELYVTLAQSCTAYQIPVASHDWRESTEYVDSADFSNDICYINPIAMPEDCETFKTDDGWSVRRIENGLV